MGEQSGKGLLGTGRKGQGPTDALSGRAHVRDEGAGRAARLPAGGQVRLARVARERVAPRGEDLRDATERGLLTRTS